MIRSLFLLVFLLQPLAQAQSSSVDTVPGDFSTWCQNVDFAVQSGEHIAVVFKGGLGFHVFNFNLVRDIQSEPLHKQMADFMALLQLAADTQQKFCVDTWGAMSPHNDEPNRTYYVKTAKSIQSPKMSFIWRNPREGMNQFQSVIQAKKDSGAL